MDREKAVYRCKQVSYLNAMIMAIAWAGTSPIVHSYMISHISTDFFKIVCFISEAIGVVVYYILDMRNKKDEPIVIVKMRRHFIYVVMFGAFAMILANASYFIDIRLRFLAIAFLQGTFSCIWKNCMMDLWNLTVSGTELTIFNVKVTKFDRLGAIVGATAILFIDMDVDIALGIQIVSYTFLAGCDIYVYKKLKEVGIYSKSQ